MDAGGGADQAVRDRQGEGTTLNGIGAVHRALGRPDSAPAYFGQTLAIPAERGQPGSIGRRAGASGSRNGSSGSSWPTESWREQKDNLVAVDSLHVQVSALRIRSGGSR